MMMVTVVLTMMTAMVTRLNDHDEHKAPRRFSGFQGLRLHALGL